MPSSSISISISQQSLTLRDAQGQPCWHARISSGAAGIGCEPESGQTPTGCFRIASRHGAGAPLRCAFRARLPYASLPEQSGEQQDHILTRILTLDGLEPQNANTRARYIYIHGTADIERLGTPCSHGCIRLAPEDMCQLFEHCPLGTLVTIHP